jgi:hypothetical protein
MQGSEQFQGGRTSSSCLSCRTEKDVYQPEFLAVPRALIKCHPSLEQMYLPNNYYLFEEQLVQRVNRWLGLLLFDRRRDFQTFKTPELGLLGTTPMMFLEGLVGDSTAWILPNPIFLGTEKGWDYYLGSQLGNVGSTYLCKSCQTAIKYYMNSESGFTPQCPKCGCGKELEYEPLPDVLSGMGKKMVQYKEKMSKDYYGI